MVFQTDDNADAFDIVEGEQSTDALNGTSVMDSVAELDAMFKEIESTEIVGETVVFEGSSIEDFNELRDTLEKISNELVEGTEDTAEVTEEEHGFTGYFEGTEDTQGV